MLAVNSRLGIVSNGYRPPWTRYFMANVSGKRKSKDLTFMVAIALEMLKSMIRAAGVYELPVHELTRQTVLDLGAKIRPFSLPQGFTKDPNAPTGRGNLQFSLWQLMHAVKKAECLEDRSSMAINISTIGSLIEHFDLFGSGPELRLSDGASRRYADFSSTSLAGRLAQGVTLLLMEREGYIYSDRIETLVKRNLAGIASTTLIKDVMIRANVLCPSQSPDFIVQREDEVTALAESKGSFLISGSKADVKGPLRDALSQLGAWSQILVPIPQKSFAVASFLREQTDPSREPSMVIFVDPPADETFGRRNYSHDAVRRGNYASGLRQMALNRSARELSEPQEFRGEATPPTPFMTFQIPGLGIRIACTAWAVEVGGNGFFVSPNDSRELLMATRELSDARWLVSGMDAAVLKRISQVISNGGDLSDIRAQPASRSAMDGPVQGSLLRDGSFFGLVEPKALDIGEEEFLLS